MVYHIYLASYFQEIIENSLTSGIFLIYMKTAYVTPIIKNLTSTNPSSPTTD